MIVAKVHGHGTVYRGYKQTMLAHVADFLIAVKASLVKLGVDENRLHHITKQVGVQYLHQTALETIWCDCLNCSLCV